MWTHRLRRERQRFLGAQLSSLAATLATWVVAWAVLRAGGHYLEAATAGALGGAALDFQLKKHWVFAARGAVVRQARRYALVAAASAALNDGASWMFVALAHLARMRGVLAASVVVAVVWNYPMQRFFVFGRGETKSAWLPDGTASGRSRGPD